MGFALKLAGVGRAKDEIERRVEQAAQILDITELLRPHAQAALGRPAPARRHGPRHRARPQGVPVRRAAVQPRRQAARATCASRSSGCTSRCATTTVYVTHDQVEAMTLGDRVVVLNDGPHRAGRRAEATSTRRRPPSFVAGFIGSPAMNFIACRVEQDGGCAASAAERYAFLPGAGRPDVRAIRRMSASPACCWACVRSTSSRPGRTSSANQATSQILIDVVEPMGMETLVYFTIEAPSRGRVNPNAGATAESP